MNLKLLLLSLLLSISSFAGSVEGVDSSTTKDYRTALTRQDIAEKALRSTVVLKVKDKNGKLIKFGSGFVINDGKVVTNYHVVSGGLSGYIGLNQKKYKILGVLAKNKKRDLVILKIAKHNIPPLVLSKNKDLKIGDSIYVAGSPFGLSSTFSEGIVSSIRQSKNISLYQITAPISLGSSGGPVLNNMGEVIGISTSTIKKGQNINFATPSFYLQEMSNNDSALIPLSALEPKKKKVNLNNKNIKSLLDNKKEKLDDICCAFGIQLGKKTKNIQKYKDGDQDYAAYFRQLDIKEGRIPNPPSYNGIDFIPQNKYPLFSSYKLSLIDEEDKVYRITASGSIPKNTSCEIEKLLLIDIVKNKYEVKQYEIQTAAQIDSWIFQRNNRSVTIICNNKFELILQYLDLDLKLLKDVIYKEKLLNARDSSGLGFIEPLSSKEIAIKKKKIAIKKKQQRAKYISSLKYWNAWSESEYEKLDVLGKIKYSTKWFWNEFKSGF